MAAAVSACSGSDGAATVDDIPLAAARSDDGRTVMVVDGQTRPDVVIPATWPSAVDELYGRYWLYWEAFAAAHGPPWADPAYEPLRSLSTDTNWASLTEQLGEFSDDGLVLVLPPDSITQHMIRLPGTEVLTKEEGHELILQDCWIDDFIQRTVDGDVVSEAREAKLMNVVMRVVDGEWRVDGIQRADQESDGYEQCIELLPR
jgi:hypothetical protein